MTITLYQTKSPSESLTKTLENALETTGTARGDIDIVRPVVRVAQWRTGYNYAYIEQFARYYHIIDHVLLAGGLTELTLECDVLSTYADDIKNSECIAARATRHFNAYLPDNSYPLSSDMVVINKVFSGGDIDSTLLTADNPTIVLVVSANENEVTTDEIQNKKRQD